MRIENPKRTSVRLKINLKGETKMKTYRIVVKDVYEVEANSPREAKAKFADADKGSILVEFTESKPKLIKS
jgi:hypothetical protein